MALIKDETRQGNTVFSALGAAHHNLCRTKNKESLLGATTVMIRRQVIAPRGAEIIEDEVVVEHARLAAPPTSCILTS